ncbi:MAG: hypothetical protein KAU23_06265 [Anaerolineales bacterium]|nr:hypothetical protein [Anaerolineales bacterium]
MERANAVTMGGNPLTLVGPELKVGDKAPEFTLLDGAEEAGRLMGSRWKL